MQGKQKKILALVVAIAVLGGGGLLLGHSSGPAGPAPAKGPLPGGGKAVHPVIPPLKTPGGKPVAAPATPGAPFASPMAPASAVAVSAGHPPLPGTGAPGMPGLTVATNSVTDPAQQAIQLVRTISDGDAVPVATFPGPHGMVEVIYRARGVLDAAGKPLYSSAWVMPRYGLVGLGDLIGAHGNVIGGPATFALHAEKNPVTAETASATAGAGSVTAPAGSSAATANDGLVNAETAALLHGQGQAAIGAVKSMNNLDAALDPLNSFVEGSAGPIVTVFASPNSERAMALFRDAEPLIKEGKMRIRWVPIGTGARSLAISEAILAAPESESSWALNFRNFNQKMHVGGVGGEQNTRMESIVDGNTEILARMGRVSTIEAFYCDRKSARVVENPGPVTAKGISAILPKIGSDCG